MKSKILLIISAFIIGSLLILSSPSIIKGLNKASIIGDDFTINSITSTQIISNDNDLNTANFIISATANGGGQSIVGTFDSSEFKRWTGYDITYPLKIGISGVTETLRFPIRNDGTPLYKLRPLKIYRSSYWTGATCPDQATDGYYQCYNLYDTPDQYGLGNDAIIKVYRDIVGSTGSFDNPFISWNGVITMTVAGVPITKTIDSVTAQSIEFYVGNEWKGTARWTGSLVSGNPTPNQNLYKAVYSKNIGSWRVSSLSYYNNYINTIFSPIKTQKNCTLGTCYLESDITNPISEYNSKVDVLTSQNDKISYTSATGTTFTQTTNGGETDGNIISTAPFAVGYPVFQFIVKAKSLGVLIPVSKPQIVSVSSPDFSSGDNTGTVTVKFTNAGTTSGSFTASINQINFPFYQQGTATPTSVKPLEYGTISLMIGHGTATSGAVSGIVRVYDTNKPSNFDEKPFSSTMTVPKACIPGSPDVRGNLVYACKSDGSGYELILECINGQIPVFEGGKYICKTTVGSPTPTPNGGTNNTITSEPTVTKWYENPWLILGLLITAISTAYYLSTKKR